MAESLDMLPILLQVFLKNPIQIVRKRQMTGTHDIDDCKKLLVILRPDFNPAIRRESRARSIDKACLIRFLMTRPCGRLRMRGTIHCRLLRRSLLHPFAIGQGPMNKKERKTCDTGHNKNGHKHFVCHKNLSFRGYKKSFSECCWNISAISSRCCWK